LDFGFSNAEAVRVDAAVTRTALAKIMFLIAEFMGVSPSSFTILSAKRSRVQVQILIGD
jgi:purine nucleoside permease